MARSRLKIKGQLAPVSSSPTEVGEIVAIDEQGRAYVRFPGSDGAVVLARSTLDASTRVGDSPQALLGAPVLLAFENGDFLLPIVIGLIHDAARPEPAVPEFKVDLRENRDVLIDGRRIVFDAQKEIELRCGKSTIVLQSDGKVLIRGAHLVSRSSGPNKIKGGSINLN